MAVANPQIADIADRVRTDPVWFAENVLGHELWDTPRNIMASMAVPNAETVVKACHASSKTFTAAELVLWTPFAGGIALTTAPTGRQVKRLVWTEIRAMYPHARYLLGGEMLQTEFRIAPDLYALGLATDAGVNFQGFHSRPDGFVLIVVDEAVGVDPSVFTAIEGIRAGGDVRVLALGNPDSPSGPFYDMFTGEKIGWDRYTINAFNTPNLRGITLSALLAMGDDELDANPYPYLVTRRWVRDRYEEWGEGSALWWSRVLGEFPQESQDSLIALKWIYDAHRRTLLADPTDVICAGLDVAGPGEDESVLRIRQGPKLIATHAWHEADTLRLLGAIRAALRPYQDRLAALVVDAIGIGYHLGGALTSDYGQRVVLLNVGVPSRFPHNYGNLKAELYWGLRERFQQGDIGGPMDEMEQGQLASLRYHHTERGLIVIESKDELRKRGVRSPDRAEAMMLAFAPVVEHRRVTGYRVG